MCGRFVLLSDKDNAEIERILHDIEDKYGDKAFDGSDITPSNKAPVYVAENAKATAYLYTWGYPKFDGDGLIYNARSETAAEKKLFAQSMQQHRCIVPASGFYEGRKKEGFFTLESNAVMYLAGLYQPGKERLVILTTAANTDVKPFHHRMPVILPKEWIPAWLTDAKAAAQLLQSPQPKLIANTA